MEKLKMHSPNFTEENIAKLAELFPGCVTEKKETAKDAKSTKIKKVIDWDLLKQELSDHIVEGPQERYHLNWPGKREALLTANAPIAKTLRPCREESVNFDTTENLFIEGDNLDALKLLQETYLGKVKMIYIDPPYNTGKDFIYADNFAESTEEYLLESGQKDEEGNRLIANSDSNGRFHSDWLSMMYSRLKLARNLLKDDGVIFISIDDNEVHNIRKLCDEIFGVENFLTVLIWKSRQIIDSRNKNNASNDHEYVLAYSREVIDTKLRGKEIALSKYKNPDNDPRGPWMSNSILGLANASQRPNLHYAITNPETGISYNCPEDTGWRYSRETMSQKISEGRIVFPQKEDGRPREKKYLKELSDRFTGFSSILSEDAGYTLNGTREVRDMLNGKLFDFPKPVSLLKILIQQGAWNNDDIVLDFFAGSATTTHAVMQQNAEDNGKRKFIMVQLPEACDEKSEAFKAGYKTIAEISKERIRRAGKKIKEDLTAKNTHDTNREIRERHETDLFAEGDKENFRDIRAFRGSKELDTGFRVLKVDSSNMADVYYTPDAVEQNQLNLFTDNIKDDRTSEDLLFQVLLDWGVDLTLPIRKELISTANDAKNTKEEQKNPSFGEAESFRDFRAFRGSENQFEVFFVDDNALAACFEKDGKITEDFCKELAERQPLRVVFRDSGFKDDSVKINVEQIFKLMSPHTEVKTI